MAAQTETSISVHVDSEPHTTNRDGVLLNRPLPNGGSFVIHQRIPPEIWREMREAGATYYDEDFLEDMDMFHVAPGWRYSLSALEVLIAHGYTLSLRDEEVSTVEHLQAMFTDAAKAAYHARIEREREEAARAAEEARQEAERRIAAKGVAYEAWKAEHLSGLVRTTAGPRPQTDPVLVPGGVSAWEEVARFDRETPGTWYDTGDTWYRKMVNGQMVYRCHYGNAIIWYASQTIVDAWMQEHWFWLVEEVHKGDANAAARGVLSYYEYVLDDSPVYGSDTAARLVELHGLDHYIQLASGGEEWFVNGSPPAYATRHNLPYTIVQQTSISYQQLQILPRGIIPAGKSIYQADDGRYVIGSGSVFTLATPIQVRAIEVAQNPPDLTDDDCAAIDDLERQLKKAKKADVITAAEARGLRAVGSKDALISAILRHERQQRRQAALEQALEVQA